MLWQILSAKHISIHVPRVEDDEAVTSPAEDDGEFQSTSPVWRTTRILRRDGYLCVISIHVPRVEDDSWICESIVAAVDFNPRPPCGGRPELLPQTEEKILISIHVPRVEDDGDII